MWKTEWFSEESTAKDEEEKDERKGHDVEGVTGINNRFYDETQIDNDWYPVLKENDIGYFMKE